MNTRGIFTRPWLRAGLASATTAWLLTAALAQGQIVDGAKISVDEPPPHGETGISTSRPYTRHVAKPAVDVRERWFHPGSLLGEHVLTHDQIFYLTEGAADVAVDGVVRRLGEGDMAYAFDGSSVALTPVGNAPAKVIMAWPHPSQLETAPAAQVVDELPLGVDEPTPHGFVGMTRVYNIFPPSADRGIELRKRVYQPGAKLGRHMIPRDFAYYVVSGEGVLTTGTTKTALKPGIAVYIPRRSEIAVQQTGSEPLDLMMIWPAEQRHAKPPGVFVNGAKIATDEPPHGGKGMSTVERLTDAAKGRRTEMRKRVLHVGAEMAPYTVPRDQAFLILDGEGVLMVDGKSQPITSNQLAYIRKDSNFSLKQVGAKPLSVLMVWTLAEKTN